MDTFILKEDSDVIDVEITPGEPDVCLGNGNHGSECCHEECDYFLFCYPEKMYKNNIIPKKDIDVTGIELTPGDPDVCLGNGEQGFECCCDECDYFLLCSPEFDVKIDKKSNNKKPVWP